MSVVTSDNAKGSKKSRVFQYRIDDKVSDGFQQPGGVGKGPSGRYIEVSVLVPHLGTLKNNLWGRAWHCNQ